MPDFLIWVIWAIIFIGAIFFTLNELRRWRKPYLFRGNTGPPGVSGEPGVCNGACCTGSFTYNSGKGSLDGPMSKEALYNLPEIPDDK